MSHEYRQRFVDKISEETTAFLASWPWPSAEAAITAGMAFTKKRIKHYGLNNRYLPPDFKRIVREEPNGDNPAGATAETNPTE